MGYFIGLPIPAELRGQITEFCRERQYVSTEPHIKLLSAVSLKNSSGVQHKLESFCLAQTEFRIVVAGPGCHNNQILYLTVLPGAINLMRDRLARHLKANVQSVFRPHVTLMRQYAGRNMELDRYLEEARQIFTKPFSFGATQAALYSQDSEFDPFKEVMNTPFTGRFV